MCDFRAAAALGLAALQMTTQAMSISNQNKVAKAEAEAANDAAVSDYYQLDQKSNQLKQKAGLEATERMRQGLRERAKIRVAMGESGMEGNSTLRELSNSFLQESYDMGINQENLENSLQGVQAERESVGATNRGRLNTARSKVTNPFMAGLQIAGAGASGAMTGYTFGKGIGGGASPTTPKTGG